MGKSVSKEENKNEVVIGNNEVYNYEVKKLEYYGTITVIFGVLCVLIILCFLYNRVKNTARKWFRKQFVAIGYDQNAGVRAQQQQPTQVATPNYA